MIHRVPAGETNCYLLRGEGGVILVDPGPPGRGDGVIAGALAAGVDPAEVRLILVTHGHLDHYGAAPVVQVWCGAPVAAHPVEPGWSRDRRNALPPAGTLRGSVVRWFYLLLSPLARYQPLSAGILLEDNAELSPYGLDARVLLLPGHSPGMLGVLLPKGDFLAGDLFVNYSVPSQPLYLDDREAWQRSYDRIRALAPTTVHVGHGEPFPGTALSHIYPPRYQLRWWVR